MQFIDPIPTANMTDHQRAWFYAEFAHARRDEVIGVLLAIFLGNFGIHQFYIRRNWPRHPLSLLLLDRHLRHPRLYRRLLYARPSPSLQRRAGHLYRQPDPRQPRCRPHRPPQLRPAVHAVLPSSPLQLSALIAERPQRQISSSARLPYSLLPRDCALLQVVELYEIPIRPVLHLHR